MKTISRELITDLYFKKILQSETHHDHKIVEDENGTLRWKEDALVLKVIKAQTLNAAVFLLTALGLTKNSELYRKLYRDIGYSLNGYWEIFYDEINNEEACNYGNNIS